MLPPLGQFPDALAAVADCGRRLCDREAELTELMERTYFQGMVQLLPGVVEDLAHAIARGDDGGVAWFGASVRWCDRGVISTLRARTVEKFAVIRADVFRLSLTKGPPLFAPSAHEGAIQFARWAAGVVRQRPPAPDTPDHLSAPIPELRAAIDWERHRVRALHPLPAAPGANDDLRPRCDGALMCSPSFHTVVFANDTFYLSDPQARVFRVLVEAYERNGMHVRHADLRRAAATGAASIRDVFRSNGKQVLIWRKRLIVPFPQKRGYYVLNLGSQPAVGPHRSAG